MQWLTPLTALYAAAVSVPLLLLLYFLKLKRRQVIVSSTLLWKRAVQDLQVNAPFQRLRRNILLLLQLLALLAVLLCLAGPILSLTARTGRRYVILIDRSASMNAVEGDTTRLQEAKKQAKIFVESLQDKSFFSLAASSDQTMVIAFDSHPKVMCNFTSDKPKLDGAIDAITPSDGKSSLAEAIVVAQAFAQSPGVEADFQSAEEPAHLVLFSDGRIADLEQVVVTSDELLFRCIGKSGENVALTAMQAKRSYENPEQVEVFSTVANYGASPVTCDVQLSVNADVRALKSVTIPAKSAVDGSEDSLPGKVAVSFALAQPDAGVVEVRHLHSDPLASDDAAWAVLPPPKRLSVLLVADENPVLESALKACSLERLDLMSGSQFDANDRSDFSIEQSYDIIVLDNHLPARLPKCRYLIFGPPPAGIDVSVSQQLKNQVVVDWRPRHAVLKYVNLANLFAAKSLRMDLPRDAEVLAEFNESPALALLRRKGSVFLLAGFDVLESNWPFEPSFVLFCYNAVQFLGGQVGRHEQNSLNVGEPIVVEGVTSETEARIDGPYFSDTPVMSSSAGSIHFPGTSRAGVYNLRIPEKPPTLFAVNLLDQNESGIEPRRQIVLAGLVVEAEQQAVSRANMPLWPFLVGLALMLACVEWLVYNLKVKI